MQCVCQGALEAAEPEAAESGRPPPTPPQGQGSAVGTLQLHGMGWVAKMLKLFWSGSVEAPAWSKSKHK